MLNFITIISQRIQVYYLQKCCETFFLDLNVKAHFFVGLVQINLEPGPKHVHGGPKTVKREHDPGQ